MDERETNVVNIRRKIYTTIMSSVNFTEAGCKLLEIDMDPDQEMELCHIIIDCCSRENTYIRYYARLAEGFCNVNETYQENFEKCFVQLYSNTHHLEAQSLRNVAVFFADLLGSDALSWKLLAYIRLSEDATTNSSRSFVKILFQELSGHIGVDRLNARLNDPKMRADFELIFPRDDLKNTRFSIMFFMEIGLGGVTKNLKEYLEYIEEYGPSCNCKRQRTN